MNDSSTTCRLDYCENPASTKKHQLCSGHDAQMRRGKPFKPLGPSKYEPGTLCSFDDCEKPVKNFGLCVAHYAQKRRGGPLKTLLKPGETPNRCSLQGCERFGNRRGLCVEHQAQADAGLKPYVAQKPCDFPECGRRAQWRGLCVSHGQQRAKGKELTPIKRKRDNTLPCDFPSCGRDVCAVGLCSGHYNQKRKGRELTPIKQVERRARRTTEEILQRDADGRKQCSKCATWNDEQEYYKHRGTADNLNPECRSCCRAKTANTSEQTRASNVERLYKLTPGQFDAILKAQGGVCAACNSKSHMGKNWAVDHDHSCCPGRESCGRCVRGILCNPCNLALGVARDNAARLRGMADYLDAWNNPLGLAA